MKAEPIRLISQKLTANLEVLMMTLECWV